MNCVLTLKTIDNLILYLYYNVNRLSDYASNVQIYTCICLDI